MKGHAALVELSEFDWSEAELSCHGRDGRAGASVIARYEDGLMTPLQRRICSKLCRSQVIEAFTRRAPANAWATTSEER